jgi:hypothetical protein
MHKRDRAVIVEVGRWRTVATSIVKACMILGFDNDKPKYQKLRRLLANSKSHIVEFNDSKGNLVTLYYCNVNEKI